MGSLKRQLQAMEQVTLEQAVLVECERVSELLGLDAGELKQEALWLLEHAHLAPPLTPERIEWERQTLYGDAKRQCARRGIDFEDVRAEVDALADALAQALPGS